jgi:phosphoribosylamine--glycine ligase
MLSSFSRPRHAREFTSRTSSKSMASWLVTGTSGVVLIVCGVGPTMGQAQRQAYNRVRNVMIPNMYYREDIGDRWSEEDSDRLHSWRYLRES